MVRKSCGVATHKQLGGVLIIREGKRHTLHLYKYLIVIGG